MITEQPAVEEAKAQVATQTASPPPDTTADDVPTAPITTEPSPAQTPLVPPPGTRAKGTAATPEPVAPEPTATPAATPPTETSPLPPEPFADELPPDFWGDALEPPLLASTSSEPTDTLLSTPSPNEPTAPDRPAAPAPSSGTAKPLEGSLQKDPRFVLLQELFPGHISEWHAEPVANGGEDGADGAADAPVDPETVDLEAGLDADETDL